jgi:hypothetical protein
LRGLKAPDSGLRSELPAFQNPRTSKEIQTNPRESKEKGRDSKAKRLGFPWIPLDSFVRIVIFQWVTTDPTKKTQKCDFAALDNVTRVCLPQPRFGETWPVDLGSHDG